MRYPRNWGYPVKLASISNPSKLRSVCGANCWGVPGAVPEEDVDFKMASAWAVRSKKQISVRMAFVKRYGMVVYTQSVLQVGQLTRQVCLRRTISLATLIATVIAQPRTAATFRALSIASHLSCRPSQRWFFVVDLALAFTDAPCTCRTPICAKGFPAGGSFAQIGSFFMGISIFFRRSCRRHALIRTRWRSGKHVRSAFCRLRLLGVGCWVEVLDVLNSHDSGR